MYKCTVSFTALALMLKYDYFALLEKEEEFRLNEQSALINSLLSGSGSASKGKLSLLRRAGLAMTGLEVVGKRSGTGGIIIIEFKGLVNKESSNKSNKKQAQSIESQIQPACFKPGDLVKLIIGGSLLLECIGTVERSPKDIDVSVSINGDSDELDDLMTSKVSLVKMVDDVGMFGKMKGNLEMILEEKGEMNELRLFMKQFIENIGKSDKEIASDLSDINTSNLTSSSRLNAEQELAVRKCLEMLSSQSTQSHVLIHGPPGTGKTSVLVELIRRLRQSQQNTKTLRILVCGPSNLSVDNILERLQTNLDFDQKIIRIGHPSRVLETCQKNTLDFWCENSDSGLLLKDVQKEIDGILKIQLPRCKSREERRGAYAELKELRRERREREKKLQINLIDEAEIVFCTLGTACGRKLLTNSKRKFDLAIVDEAGQALLPEILIVPILSDKLILAGDHFQLPPTVMNPEIKETLQVSLFEHLIRKGASIMLKEQYRMNELIMKWSNAKFYSNQLRAAGSVADWKIDDQDVLVFYDTCGFDLWESNEEIKGGMLIEGNYNHVM